MRCVVDNSSRLPYEEMIMRQWDDGVTLIQIAIGKWQFMLPSTFQTEAFGHTIELSDNGQFDFCRECKAETFPLFEDAVTFGHNYLQKYKNLCDKNCKPESCDRVKYTVSLMSGDIFQVNACEANTVEDAICVVKNHLHTLVDKLDSYNVTVHV